MLQKNKYRGFSLQELIITIVMLGILVAFSYPSYKNYIYRSHRIDALTTLLKVQLILEECYAQNFSYALSCQVKPQFPLNSEQNFYQINANLKKSTYLLIAIPQGKQIGDLTCANISVNAANVRRAEDSDGLLQPECWQ